MAGSKYGLTVEHAAAATIAAIGNRRSVALRKASDPAEAVDGSDRCRRSGKLAEQMPEVFGDGRFGPAPDLAIPVETGAAGRRKLRSAAPRAAGFGFDDRLAHAGVHLVDQQPCSPVRHRQVLRRGRDRAGLLDGFEKRDLAGADCDMVALADPEPKLDDGFHGAKHNSPRGSWPTPCAP